MTTCSGTTKDGEPCQRKATRDGNYCAQHTPGRIQERRKRSSDFGSLEQLPSGKWRASYNSHGNRGRQTFTTRASAKAFLATVQTDLLRGELRWIDPRSGRVAFGAYAESWLLDRSVRPTTRAKYRGLLDGHILPTFKDKTLATITDKDVERWYRGIAKDRQATAAGAYRLLASIFNTAVADRSVPSSPCRVEHGSRERSPERPTVKVEQLQRAVNSAPERFRCALLLAAWCQLRRGEVLGLQRGDINLETGKVSVQRAWTLAQDGRCYLDRPKTEAGVRTVYLPAPFRPVLADHLERFVGPEASAWLFAGRGGNPSHPRQFLRAWGTARDAVGRSDLHIHDLRHSGLTWAAQSGAALPELMRQAGHKSPVAAIRYLHAADERSQELAGKLGAMATNGS